MTKIKRRGLYGKSVVVEVGDNCTIHETAMIGSGVTLGNNVVIHEGVTIMGERTVIGDGCVLGRGVYLGRRARIGNGVRIGAHTVIEDDVQLTECIIQEKVRIGNGTKCRSLRIEKHVTIGERCHIRSTTNYSEEKAILRDSVKIGNNVSISCEPSAPNAMPGGISSGVTIGDNCTIEWSRGVGHGSKIKDDVEIFYTQIRSDTIIGEGCVVDKATIEHNVHIGAYSVISARTTIPGDWRLPEGSIVNPTIGNAPPLVLQRPLLPRG